MSDLLEQQLASYTDFWSQQPIEHAGLTSCDQMRDLHTGRCNQAYDRDEFPAHFTGSALVTNPEMTHVLLTLHAKLDMWIQLGGHADGEQDLANVALREAQEESGLLEVSFYHSAVFNPADKKPLLPFDLDIHTIPARKDEPEHQHFDVRFLLLADPKEPFTVTHESKDLKWLSLSEARSFTSEMSMLRQFAKLEHLRTLTL